MIIAKSAINMAAQHQKEVSTRQEESLEVIKQSGDSLVSERVDQASVEVSLSRQGELMAQKFSGVAGETGVSGQTQVSQSESSSLSIKMKLAKSIIEAMTGTEIKLGVTAFEASQSSQAATDSAQMSLDGETVGMRYTATEVYHEAESLAFSGKGVVHTTDGQKIEIDLAFSMSRSFTSVSTESFSAGVQLQDPLVINYAGSAVELTSDKMAFDLDSDGMNESISFTKPGSGMLMLDKNGDGIANNGSELFGAQTGNGFAELAAYDEDGNGFIDEGDSVYSQLQIWTRVDGRDEMHSLAEKDIGAIYLGAVATPFELKTEDNELLGVVRGSSVFLGEDGRVGSVQQIDLVV